MIPRENVVLEPPTPWGSILVASSVLIGIGAGLGYLANKYIVPVIWGDNTKPDTAKPVVKKIEEILPEEEKSKQVITTENREVQQLKE